jgi:two-component system cell cycle sensor histidine kinase/response regulator CckA
VPSVLAQLSLIGNVLISAAYAAITAAIALPLIRLRQLGTNRLATATALIFFSCSVGHAFHAAASWSVAMGSAMGAGMAHGTGGPAWPPVFWDLLTAGVGVYYWSLRRGYGALVGNGALYQQLISEVKAQEQSAETHRAALAAVVEYSDDAIIGTALDGTVTTWNGGAERLFGYSAADAVGAPASVLVDAAGAADRPEILARIAAGEPSIRFETRLPHRDGSPLDISVTVSPIRGGDGAMAGLSVIARDVTLTKRAEVQQRSLAERSHQADRMESLGQLAGGVAHDFNNLLAIIVNFNTFAAEQAVGRVDLLADLDKVRTAADRAAALTRQLLVFTRRDAVKPEDVDLNDSIVEVQAMLARTIGEHIELVAVPSQNALVVRADVGQLQQVLMNLALNARDAMPDGGMLIIEAELTDLEENQTNIQPSTKAGSYARLVVSDSGDGMTPEIVDHIFEPFFTTKPRGQGTGLGLATVYGIVTEAGGGLDVYSEPGVGTTFRIYLPAVRGQVAARPPETAQPAPGGGGRRVLVVEDEPALVELVERILSSGGYQVLTAPNGPEALRISAEHRYDLLLTDVIMPDMSGRRLADLLHAKDPDLPVLFMSGYSNGLLGTTHILDQGIAFIEKPFTADRLLHEVGDMFAAEPRRLHPATPAADR